MPMQRGNAYEKHVRHVSVNGQMPVNIATYVYVHVYVYICDMRAICNDNCVCVCANTVLATALDTDKQNTYKSANTFAAIAAFTATCHCCNVSNWQQNLNKHCQKRPHTQLNISIRLGAHRLPHYTHARKARTRGNLVAATYACAGCIAALCCCRRRRPFYTTHWELNVNATAVMQEKQHNDNTKWSKRQQQQHCSLGIQ